MKIKILIAFVLCIASSYLLGAQETASGLELLTVNDQVTTVSSFGAVVLVPMSMPTGTSSPS